MATLMLVVSFIGSWLLFAGPIYQAAIELYEEDVEFAKIKEVASRVEKPKPVSLWWWLIPPLELYFEKRAQHAYRLRYIKALSKEEVTAVISFRSKATAWLLVSLGGLCFAINDTYDLTRHEKWGNLILIGLVIAMAIISILHLVFRINRVSKIKNL